LIHASESGGACAPAFRTLAGGLIVSCQVPDGTAIDTPQFIAAQALTVLEAGAVGIRAQGTANVAAIAKLTSVPIIGLVQRYSDSTPIHITAREADVAELDTAGASIVAVDATGRLRPNGVTLQDFLAAVRRMTDVPLLADVDTLEAGIIATSLGFEAVATTLSGYTDKAAPDLPNIELVESLATKLDVPVIAEGGFNSPDHARQAFEAGAWSVCIGTAITNPFLLTRRFVGALD
jgi:N-acylglucosamine-6-phosphate 2-epimerase